MSSSLSRRTLIKRAAGSAVLAGVGMPAIVRGQADAIRIGHLTPLTGFLGPLGEYAVMGVKLAAEEINDAGGVMGRKIELVMEDSVNPQTASAKAERLIERDKVAMIIGEISSASGLAIGQVANRLKFRRAAGRELQTLHVPHRGRELDVRDGGRAVLAAREPRTRQEVVLADGGLRLRPRPSARCQEVHGVERRPV